MEKSANKRWKIYCKRSGNDMPFNEFCELENKYASERISKEQLKDASRFHNDNGNTAQVIDDQQPVMNVVRDEKFQEHEVEEEEEKIFGMPRKVAIGLGIFLLFICLTFGVWIYVRRSKTAMPGIATEGTVTTPAVEAGAATATSTPASGQA